MGGVLGIFIDLMMAALLGATLWYCARLNKRIQVLQDAKSELAQIIQEFDESTQRATQSIAEIHKASTRIAENIQHKIDKANFLADDLQFLIERSAKITDKADVAQAVNKTSAARAAEAEKSTASSGAPEGGRAGLRLRSKAEQELLNALKTNE
jgi:hypothetical protein